MNELLAIVIIVVVCCAIFFAWLLSMATCPDKMINWLSGTTGNSTCSTSYESKELIARDEQDDKSVAVKSNDAQNSSIYLQLNNVARRSNSKKLSVVPEQDEQLTVTSISQILFPTPNRQNNYANGKPASGAQQLASHFEANDDVPEAVVVVDGRSNIITNEQLAYEEATEFNGAQPLRFHYSMPILST